MRDSGAGKDTCKGRKESPDNKHMRELQGTYLATRNEGDLGRLYEAMVSTSLRIICKLCRKIPGMYSEEDKEEKAHNAAVYLVEQYQTRPDFVLTKSISGYLYKRCQHELYYERKVDKIVIFSSAVIDSLDEEKPWR